MNKILVIDDAPEYQLLISKIIGNNTTSLSFASNRDEALNLLTTGHFDLILLDINLHSSDGFQLLSEIKLHDSIKEIPIFFLTGNNETSAKIMAFSVGADDYITKQAPPLELRARVEAKLRKLESKKSSEQIVIKGPLKVNLAHQKLYLIKSGNELDLGLTPIEFRLMNYLIRHEDHVLSREQLISAIWGPCTDIFDRTVDTHISALRRKLGEHGQCIESVIGSGYRFSQSYYKT